MRVRIEVGGSDGRMLVVVLAENIEQAVTHVRRRYAGQEARVLFPLDPESFFVRDGTFRACMVESERRWPV